MRSIYEYSDYRTYLRDYYEDQKSRNPAFSYRFLSLRAEVASSAFFKLVIEGKRNLTKQSVLKVAKALHLEGPEAEYLENLVFFNQAESIQEKNHYFDRMVQSQKHMKIGAIQAHNYNYFAEWWHPVVRELVVIMGGTDDAEIIAKKLRPAVTPQQVRGSLDLLLRLGFLRRTAQGKLEQTEPALATGPTVNDVQIINYQIRLLQLASEAFDRVAPAERLSSATTLAISQANFPMFLGKIRAFRAQLQELARADADPEVVYLLNLNFFPLSKSGK